MTLEEIGHALNIQVKGGEYPIQGMRDIERLAPEQPLEENYLYFIETKNILKRHPLAPEHGAVLTTALLQDQFKRALVAPEGEARLAFIKLLERFDQTPVFRPGLSPAAQIDPSAKISDTATVLPGAVVMEGAVIGEYCTIYPGAVLEPYAEIGEGSVLYPCVVIGHHCRIGKRCILHGGTVVGADGFGFYDQPGQRHKIPQIGNVAIADDVEIGASCTVDRATIESTTIGAHTKIDDQVHIGHNTQVGRYVYIVGNTAIGGSVVIEDGAMISGMVIIKDHLKIAKGSIVMGMSGVAQDTEPKQAYFGTPARPAREMHKMHAALERLPDLLVKVRQLEKRLANLPAPLLPGPQKKL
ncbi:MAG: hypothetical protein A3J74_06845 [Elusimicrobia bacterium RIFCSPHIGHO2_02_FULL_57_9]|nr:MAG: hypothetical protein A3J74_06845 [Elusimicrobia bacterium RIFCSPHIGHO2_02_FULL_57_9]